MSEKNIRRALAEPSSDRLSELGGAIIPSTTMREENGFASREEELTLFGDHVSRLRCSQEMAE